MSNSHQKYVDSVLQNTQSFLEETLRENERLRALAMQLEAERLRNVEQILELRESVAKLELQQVRQQQQVSDFESENRRVFAEYSDIEQQNSNLANLYVASYRLHGSLDRAEILQVMQEIVINLIGSEELAIYERDAGGKLRALASFGMQDPNDARLLGAASPIAHTAATGEMFLCDPPRHEAKEMLDALTACIPLKVQDKVIGVIAIFHMLPQKPQLVAVDRELFDLLGSHAAMALYCCGLHARLRELS